MLWENRENAGFTAPGVPTWLPLVWDWPQYTVETEEADAGTMLKLYRALLALRRSRPELYAGDISEVTVATGVLSYVRSFAGRRVKVLLNMTSEERWLECGAGNLLLSSGLDRTGAVTGWIELRGDEAVVLELA